MELLEQRQVYLQRVHLKLQFQQLLKLALAGEVEELKGVTENVIVGANIPIGTGTVDLYMKVVEDG